MKRISTRWSLVTFFAIVLPLLSACFTILEVDQPATVAINAPIEVTLQVRTEGTDANAHYGILGLLIPNDWKVDLVTYSGDFGPDTCSFLHPDSVDGDPGGQVDFWTDSLEARFPSGEDMMWVVYQANTPYASNLDTGYLDVVIKMTTGATTGNFNLAYFVTNAALDFTDTTYYDIKLDNPIQVGGTGVANHSDDMIPKAFHLKQNFPNPFNAVTQIRFDLPQAGWTELKIYNLLGDEVKTILSEPMNAGSHEINFNASELESGIYYYRLKSGNLSAVKKLVLIK